jgi:uncharacterized protein (DUF1778 family)
MSVFSLRLPNSLQDDIKIAAQDDGISINQFIMLAVAEKVSALKQADRLAHYKAKPLVSRDEFLAALNEISNAAPVAGDELTRVA